MKAMDKALIDLQGWSYMYDLGRNFQDCLKQIDPTVSFNVPF